MGTHLKNLEVLLKGVTPKAVPYSELKPESVDASVHVEETEGHKVLLKPLIYDTLVSAINSVAPSDGKEIVDWMHGAAANTYLALYSADTYEGIIASMAGDGYIPGVAVDEWSIVPMMGKEITKTGGIKVYNKDEDKVYVVPAFTRVWLPGRMAMLFNIRNWVMQHADLLLKWRKFASLPIEPDKQYQISNIRTANGKLYSIPYIGQYTSKRLLLVRFYITLQVYDDVKPYLIVSDMSRKNLYLIELRELKGGRQYNVIVESHDIPRMGYVEFYADGVKKPPTIIYMDTKLI